MNNKNKQLKMKHLKTFKIFENINIDLDDIYDLLPDDIIEYISFLERNKQTIKGIYEDKYYGGWNGMMDSINYLIKKEKYQEPDFDIELTGFPDVDIHTLIINDVFFGNWSDEQKKTKRTEVGLDVIKEDSSNYPVPVSLRDKERLPEHKKLGK